MRGLELVDGRLRGCPEKLVGCVLVYAIKKTFTFRRLLLEGRRPAGDGRAWLEHKLSDKSRCRRRGSLRKLGIELHAVFTRRARTATISGWLTCSQEGEGRGP